jgi:hypothetical protein
MPASSNHQTTPKPKPSGHHWSELTATLSGQTTEVIDDWMDCQLADLEAKLASYITPNSLRKGLHR